MQNPFIQKAKIYAKDFFSMPFKSKISNPQESVFITSNTAFSRRSLKHFVESRKKEGTSLIDIDFLLEAAPNVIEHPQVNIPNPKQIKYPGSLLLGKYYESKQKAVMVILSKGGVVKDIISLHFRKKSDFLKFIK